MKCPHCTKSGKALVLETRRGDDGGLYRRRSCMVCDRSFVTQEVVVQSIPKSRVVQTVREKRRKAHDFGPLTRAFNFRSET